MVKEIQLTRGKVALVDDADYEWLSQYRWQAYPHRTTCYANRGDWPKSTKVWMHREILAAPTDRLVDHRDRDGLNNQRHNLRFASRSQNQANGRLQRNRFNIRGICLWNNCWQVSVGPKYIGSFSSAKAGAIAYNIAAVEAFGEFARLNDVWMLEASGVFDRAEAVHNQEKAEKLQQQIERRCRSYDFDVTKAPAKWVSIVVSRNSGLTLREIGQGLGISRQRIHQILNTIFAE